MSGGELSSTSVLMAFPHVDIQMGTEGRVSLTHPVLETKVEGSSETLEAFRYFEKPKMLGEAMETGKVTPQILEQLLRAVLVLNVNLLVDQVPISIGRPVIFSDFVSAPPAKGAVAILGAPVDIATTRDSGTRQGPTEVRFNYPRIVAESGETLDLDFRRSYSSGRHVVDLGNVKVVPGEGVETYGARLGKIVETALDAGTTPIVIGGDHSITAPLLQVYGKKYPSIGIIHFDAHHDMYLNPIGPYEILTHGTPFRYVLKQPISYLIQLGLRTLERVPDNAQVTMDQRLSYFSSRELQRLDPEKVFDQIPRDLPCYVSFDVDCLTPDLAPETGSPVPGGLSYYQALDLLDYIATKFNIVGADFVEVSGGRGGLNTAALTVARYIAHVILASSSKKAISGYYYNY